MAVQTDVSIDVLVIGAGAAGLVAAAQASAMGSRVVLLEKNNKAGVKILMSGGTRCNLTHHTDAKGITQAFGHARRFLQPSVGSFPPDAVVKMFDRLDVATKRESTGKIFPVSNRALQVRDALQRQAVDAGVDLRLGCAVTKLRRAEAGWAIETTAGPLQCNKLIVTSGGKSWPGCGTTGDGYAWMRQVGHTIVPPRPALVPLVGDQPWMHELSGLTLENTVASVMGVKNGKRIKKPLLQRHTSWLFTHFGYSGPAAMDVSRYFTTASGEDERRLRLDMTPDVSRQHWDRTLSDRSVDGGRTRVRSLVAEHLPLRLATAITNKADADVSVAALTTKNRLRLIDLIKSLAVPITGDRGFEKAEVTAGGVCLSEVDSRTMASRVADDLYVAGEILDVDGWIGGYNFQAAFSTGRAAAIAAVKSLNP